MDPKVMFDIFLAESEELLSDLEDGLVSLESTPDDPELVNRLFRDAHTLKGNAGMVAHNAVVEIAHVLENVLERLRNRELGVSAVLVSTLLEAADVLKSLVIVPPEQAVSCSEDPAKQALLERLRGLIPALATEAAPTRATAAETPAGPRVFEVQIKLPEDAFETGQDPALLVQELLELGDCIRIDVDDTALPLFASMDISRCYLSWRVVLRTEAGQDAVESVFVFVGDTGGYSIRDVTSSYHEGVDVSAADKRLGELLVEQGCVEEKEIAGLVKKQKRIGELLVESGKVGKADIDKALARQDAARRVKRKTSIRVDTDKLDRLVNLVGELVIAVAHVNQTSRDAEASADARTAAVEALDRISRDLQEQVMAVRMVPAEETFDRLKRAVRDLANELGKHIVLETHGTETELDKNVIEQLVDPLKHIVRNCISHGIESPQERIAQGKSDTGRIQLRAAQKHGHIIIEVIDDGRGIDPEIVLAKGRERGMVPAGTTMTEKEVFDLLFQPGFSTAAQITEISGRGVGLDVVRKNVADLRGTVEVESSVGKGTTFRIKLPLTLAIIDAMNVKVGDETLSIPLLSVVELIAPRADQIKTLEGSGELVDVRGQYLPVVRLRELLDFQKDHLLARSDAECTVVVLENAGRKFGVVVDRVVDMDQAVVKPLDRSFGLVERLDAGFCRPEGIAGATILGDGNVALILDVTGIERMAFDTN